MNTNTSLETGATEQSHANLASSTPLRRRVNIKTSAIELPPQNVDLITMLALSADPQGEEKVAAYAECAVGKIYGAELTELRTVLKQGADNLQGVRRQITELTTVLGATRRYNEMDRPTEPWTWFDALQLLGLLLLWLILTGVGINAMATVLRESGIAAFEQATARYLFCMIPVALPFAFKYLARQCSTVKVRAAYHTALWIGGIVTGFVWAIMFAFTFNGLTQSAGDLVNSLSLTTAPAASSPDYKWLLMVVSLLAECLLSAGCWLTIESIVEKHQSSMRVPNPAYEHTQAEVNHWRTIEAEEEEYLGRVRGRIRAIEDAIAKYAADANAHFVGKRFANAARDEINRIVGASAVSPNNGLKAALVLAVLAIGLLGTHAGQTFVFGLSSDYARADKESVFQKTLLFVLEGAAPGDRVVVYDAVRLQPVATFDVPVGDVFRNNAKARLQRLQRPITALKQFFQNSTNATAPAMIGAVNPPEFLGLVATHLRRPGEPLIVILIGSAFYVDHEGNCSMDDAFPSDAHLAADPRDSVFSVVAKQDALVGVTLHYAYLHERFVNDFHKARIERFWSLFASAQKSSLVSFAANLDLVLARAKDNVRQPITVARPDPNDTKVEMRRVTPRTIPVWFPPTNVLTALLKTNQPPLVAVASTAPVAAPSVTPTNDMVVVITNPVERAPLGVAEQFPIPTPASNQRIGIGIMWSVKGCDFDLYVAPRPDAPELSYRNRSTSEGKYFHDYRDRNDDLDYEYVELREGFDPKAVRVFVNFYKGRAQEAKGITILRYNGKTYTRPFQFPATSGNTGFDRNTRSHSPHWIEITDFLQP